MAFVQQASQKTSASYPPASPHSASAVGVPHRLVGRRCLCPRQACRGVLQTLRCQRHHQVAHGLVVVADQLAHHTQAAVDRDRAAGRCGLAGDQSQQRALADTVGPDQRDPVSVADGEVDIAQQLGATRTSPSHVADLDRSHSGRSRYAKATLECRPVTLTSDVAESSTAGHVAAGQRSVLVRQRSQVQALSQAARGPGAAGRRQPAARRARSHRSASVRRERRAGPMGRATGQDAEIIERMRHAGIVAAEVLRLAGEMVAAGVTTDEIDVYVHDLCIERNSYPSPLNYNHFPKSVCTSVNEVICHGIPDSRALQDGDIVNIDVTTFIGGVHGDTNATFFVGNVDPASRQLVRVTEECMWHGIEAVRPGDRSATSARPSRRTPRSTSYGVVRAFIGHGIGEQFHTDVQVLHYYDERANIDHAAGHDVHHRADDHDGLVAAQDGVRRQLDSGHLRRQAHRAVRAHDPRHRRRLRRADCTRCGLAVGTLASLTG